MYWDNIRRIALYTLLILLSIAVIVGAAALFINILGLGEGDGTDSVSVSETDTSPPRTLPPETKDTEAQTEPETEEITETEKITENVINLTVYEEEKTMYALYNVNARMSYTTESDIMGLIYQGDSVVVTGETDNGWYRVNYRSYTAYVRSDLLTDDVSAAEVELNAYEKAETMYAVTDVNVREGHSTNSKILETISAGTKVTATGKTSNGWYRIDYNGGAAYIKEEYLSKDKPTDDGREA